MSEIITHFLCWFLVEYRHTKVHKRHREVHALKIMSKVEKNMHMHRKMKMQINFGDIHMRKYGLTYAKFNLQSSTCKIKLKNIFLKKITCSRSYVMVISATTRSAWNSWVIQRFDSYNQQGQLLILIFLSVFEPTLSKQHRHWSLKNISIIFRL